MLTSGGGGGSSLKEVVSFAAFSTALLLVLIEADTHLKKALMVLLSAVASWTTLGGDLLQRGGVCSLAGGTGHDHTCFPLAELFQTELEIIGGLAVGHDEHQRAPVAFCSAVVVVTSVSMR